MFEVSLLPIITLAAEAQRRKLSLWPDAELALKTGPCAATASSGPGSAATITGALVLDLPVEPRITTSRSTGSGQVTLLDGVAQGL
jgi:hypothetical protein